MRYQAFLNEENNNGIVIKKPLECTEDELDIFYDMVIDADQSYPSEGDLKGKGVYLGFYYKDDEVIAISAIKKPYRSKTVFEMAPEEAKNYKYEMGWSYTLPEHQSKGIMHQLNTTLLNKVKGSGVFSTVRIDNKFSIKGLEKLGFTMLGPKIDGMVTNLYLMVKN